MFSSPFPDGVGFVVISRNDFPSFEEIFSLVLPEEHNYISSGKSASYRVEFALGRIAARRALEEIGGSNEFALLRTSSGAVDWPEGFVGSISHTEGWAVAAVASKKKFSSLGIDLQSVKKDVRPELAKKICSTSETEWVEEEEAEARLLMIFSAKEAIYKALNPLCGEWIGFADVECKWDEKRNVFEARLCKDLGECFSQGDKFEVDCRCEEGFVLSSIAIVA